MTAMNKTFTPFLLDMMPSCHNNLFDSPLWMSVHTTILPLPRRAPFPFLSSGLELYSTVLACTMQSRFLCFSFCLFFLLSS